MQASQSSGMTWYHGLDHDPQRARRSPSCPPGAGAQHGRSAEAEIRAILERAVKAEKRDRIGDALAALGRKVGLTDADID